MGEHLSALLLDTLAAELPADPSASTHLASCADCRVRLDAVKAQRSVVLRSERSGAIFDRLAPAPGRGKSPPRWVRTRGVLLAIAASLLAIVASRILYPGDEGTRLKGQPTVELLKDAATPVTRARVGDKLWLAVGAAGKRAVGAFAVDEEGQVSVLLSSTPMPPGARVVVGGGLEVTPGSLAVFACFGEHPLPMERLQAELSLSVERAGKTPLDAVAPGGCAKTRLEVAR